MSFLQLDGKVDNITILLGEFDQTQELALQKSAFQNDVKIFYF